MRYRKGRKVGVGIMVGCLFMMISVSAFSGQTLMDKMNKKWLEIKIHKENSFAALTGLRLTSFIISDLTGVIPLDTPYYYDYIPKEDLRKGLLSDLGAQLAAELPSLDIFYLPPKPGQASGAVILVYYKNNLAHEAIFINSKLP